jgi:hypothetical protein
MPGRVTLPSGPIIETKFAAQSRRSRPQADWPWQRHPVSTDTIDLAQPSGKCLVLGRPPLAIGRCVLGLPTGSNRLKAARVTPSSQARRSSRQLMPAISLAFGDARDVAYEGELS